MQRAYVAGMPVNICQMDQIIGNIALAVETRTPLRIHTLNVDHVVQANKDAAFAQVIASADIVVPDGMPVVWVLRRRGYNVRRITGIDLSEKLLSFPYKIVLVGGKPGIGNQAAERIARRNLPGQIVGVYSPTREQILSNEGSTALIRTINTLNADILLVAFGTPLQEKWLHQYHDAITTPVRVGVGATVDFLAGHAARAPLFFQERGLEWLYRMARDPVRLGQRYLGRDWRFVPLLWKYQGGRAPGEGPVVETEIETVDTEHSSIPG